MSLAMADLPSDPDELRAFAQALQDRLAAVEQTRVTTAAELASTVAELRAAKATIQLTALEIEKLKVQLARLRRMQFGQSSERLTREIAQLELRLEELETVEAEATSASAYAGVPSPPARSASPSACRGPTNCRVTRSSMPPRTRTAVARAAAPCRRWART